jgi:hypothetical protein
MTLLKSPLGIVLVVALSIMGLAAIEAIVGPHGLSAVLPVAMLMAPLGLFLGTIYATHPSDRGFAVADRPAIRTLVSAAIGAVYASVLGLSIVGASVCVLVFAALGWLGMRWLRYLDF